MCLWAGFRSRVRQRFTLVAVACGSALCRAGEAVDVRWSEPPEPPVGGPSTTSPPRPGSEPHSEDIERLSPLGSDHITLTGRYRVLLPGLLHDRAYRALNTPEDAAAA